MTISHSIPGQLSSHINNDYPLFVDFLKAYYEWLETEDSPYYHLKNHMSFLDFQNSLDSYVSMMTKEYLEGIPEKVLANKELLIKYSKQLHQSFGTKKSFEFIFRILYGEDIEVEYPRDSILRTSDGKWIENEFMMYCSDSDVVGDFQFRQITQTREIFPGVFEYASATVNRAIKRYANKFSFVEIYVSNIEGEFSTEYPVKIGDNYEWILPIGGEIEILDQGENYIADNILEYNGEESWSYEVVVNELGHVDTRYTTLYTANEIIAELNGDILTEFLYDGKIISHPDLEPGMILKITFPIYKGLLVVGETNQGSVSTINIVDTPFGIFDSQEYVGNLGGSGLKVNVKYSTTRRIPGYFQNTDGFISADKVLQDSYYYQDFSYVIKAGIDLSRYKDIVLETLHPAGSQMFGEVNILELIILMIRDINLDIEILNVGGEILLSYVPLYNRSGFVEDWKYKFPSENIKMGNLKEYNVGDIILRSNTTRLNLHDSIIEVV